MELIDFNFELPENLIARYPLPERSASKLLLLSSASQHPVDQTVGDLPSLLAPGDLLVFNDTKVIPARLLARKKVTGGKVEVFVERICSDRSALVRLRASKRPKIGSALLVDGGEELVVREKIGEFFLLEVISKRTFRDVLEISGQVPLPPYINRSEEPIDKCRYQTIFAEEEGAVAAPTAGLHFDESLLEALGERGIERQFITLHIGSGTYQPVRNRLEEHRIHSERYRINQSVCSAIEEAKGRGSKVVAVGTTVARALESATAPDGLVKPTDSETELFISPGYKFRTIDMLLTNLHLPRSTLLMLVCAFGGYEKVMSAYEHAVTNSYRFYSYGDAMLLQRDFPD